MKEELKKHYEYLVTEFIKILNAKIKEEYVWYNIKIKNRHSLPLCFLYLPEFKVRKRVGNKFEIITTYTNIHTNEVIEVVKTRPQHIPTTDLEIVITAELIIEKEHEQTTN